MSTENSIEASKTFLKNQVIPRLGIDSNLQPLLGFPDFVTAEMFRRNGRKEKAIPYYQGAILHGRYFYYTYSLGKTLLSLNQNEQALSVLTAALHDRPQVPDIHDFRARVLEALDQPIEALTEQAHSIELDQLDPDNLRRYAWRLTRQGRLKEAKLTLTQALTYGSYDHAVLGDFGRLYLADLNDPTEALPFLKKAVRLKPDKAWYWLNYGWALNKLQNCKAVEAFQHYSTRCLISGSCDPENVEWANKTFQRMIWKEGCWREHPTLKFLGRLVKWLPKL